METKTGDAALIEKGRPFSGVVSALPAAAGLSTGAALIHLWAAPEHLAEWWGYGTFFLAAALAQGLYATLLLRWPERSWLVLAGIYGNLAIIAMYVLTRTRGIPLGPHVGHTEDPELLGMAATLSEFGLVVLLTTFLSGRLRDLTLTGLLVSGGALWALRALGILP